MSAVEDLALAQPPLTIVALGDAVGRAQVASVLDAAGRALAHARPADVPTLAPDAVVVLAAAGRPLDRVRALQAVLDLRPDLLVVCVMPGDAPNGVLRRVVQTGAVGIVREPDLGTALVATLEAVIAGQLAVPVDTSAAVAPRALSHREKEILGLVAEGCTNREIATRLFIAESTVKTHLSSAFEKLDATSRAEAIERLHAFEAAAPHA
jgi:DNA-binding NarL/FixJ family response regulator